jgi:hypothetical protein
MPYPITLNILDCRLFVTETCYSGDVLLQETFCYGDVLFRRCFVWRRFVEETFCAETFGMCAKKLCCFYLRNVKLDSSSFFDVSYTIYHWFLIGKLLRNSRFWETLTLWLCSLKISPRATCWWEIGVGFCAKRSKRWCVLYYSWDNCLKKVVFISEFSQVLILGA